MDMMADTLTQGLIAQFPEHFRGQGGGDDRQGDDA
jgi:hypothetical protein